MQRVCILAFVIAPVLVFGDANGFGELHAKTSESPTAARTRATATATPPTTLPTLTATLTSAAEIATTTTTLTTTTTTLASSNAPATITNNANALSSQADSSGTEPNDNVAATRITAEATTAKAAASPNLHVTANAETAATALAMEITPDEEHVAATSVESKSHADARGSGNEEETQINNAPKHTKRMEAAAATVSGQSNSKATIEQEANANAATVNLLQTTTPTAYSEHLATARHEPLHAARQGQHGLYRIKLAEIVTDEFGGATAAVATTSESIVRATTTTAVPQQAQQHLQHKTADLQRPDNAGIVANTNNNSRDEVAAHATQKDSNDNNRQAIPGKLNIVDLYPMPLQDFNPIIRDSNSKLLKERTIFTRSDAEAAEHRQNLLPNEVEGAPSNEQPAAHIQNANTAVRKVNRAPSSLTAAVALHRDSISDFTGKLLAEQDGVITEIEQKFRLSEFAVTETSKSTAATAATATTTSSPTIDRQTDRGNAGRGKLSHSVNHKIQLPAGYDFIDRRVKKSFDFPMHRVASDVMAMPHVDFANTKFNTDPTSNGRPLAKSAALAGESAVANGGRAGDGSDIAAGTHPEFSTTKFYNSKELYNEMMQHSRQKLKVKATNSKATTATARQAATGEVSAASRFAVLQSPKLETSTKFDQLSPLTSAGRSNYVAANNASSNSRTTKRVYLRPTSTTTTTPTTVATTEMVPTTATTRTLPYKANKYQKEVRRASRLLKNLILYKNDNTVANTNATATYLSTTAPTATAMSSNDRTAISSSASESTPIATSAAMMSSTAATPSTVSSATAMKTTSAAAAGAMEKPMLATTAAAAAAAAAGTATPAGTGATTEQRTTNPTKSTSKPIVRPRILSRLQEKINSLECEILNVPQDSHLWRGNETHELLLPIMTSENCPPDGTDCAPLLISWEGEAEIQSGDILIVEINDALLNPNERNNTNSAHNTQVYQVTRSGHEHCDVTEGILLDITPLVVDGRKLVTLYDKDLTEGVNLLIVVSELWGSQCVRLKVTTKTDNCGENAECSGKGVCYSNAAMEEYECQCCSGFTGPHCEEIDACTPSPCTNNGICVDLSQGHEGNSYQCLCPYGYAGINCQYESDPCNSAECMNGGSCVGNSTHFRCDCASGYTGPLCQHSLNECESSPCVHGICVDQEDGFRCFCQPGFAGELCNFEYNECESNPCQHDGECIDHIGGYECHCTKGYTGARCQIKVDFCANKPCPDGHRCVDHGNDFSCECAGGRNGPDCNQMPRTQCNVNPCTHGGTCWASGDSFYCACRPGYTGTMCEDEFVVETVVSSSEFMVDDTSARNFNDKTFGTSVVLKSPIELHNAYFAAGVLAAAIFIVAIVVTICHCKVNQTYRKFSTRSTSFFPILGFGRRHKSQSKLNKHWLSGKGLGSGNSLRSSASSASLARGHLPSTHGSSGGSGGGGGAALHAQQQQGGQLHERPFQRHLAMNLENDMYYTVDFSEHSQHSPLIQ